MHSPASVETHYGDANQEGTWSEYIDALASLSPDIKAIGVTDYFTVEGYRRVREAKATGRLPNLELILPVVELRLSTLVGSADLGKLNFHVLFSDALSADDIQTFFLNYLAATIHLDDREPWRGCVGTKEGLESLGSAVWDATPPAKRSGQSKLRIGLASAAVDLSRINDVLNHTVLSGQYLTGLGLSEWNDMRWDGAGAAQKRDVIERANFVLTASPTVAKYFEQREKLRLHRVNDRLFQASDAHYFASAGQPNRLGESWCWVKADLTFRGLRRAIKRFDHRVFVGTTPEKLDRVRRNKTKYVRGIEIRRRSDASLDEVWFDTSLELSPDLTAVIGNQGSGKSALTDVIALCGGSKVDGFGFLNADRFCSKDHKASNFVAELVWESGDRCKRRLDDARDGSDPERVRYIPQGFFETVTNETAITEGGRFYGEIKKVIFSHVAKDDRLDCRSFDELVAAHTSAAADSLRQLREELSDVNREILALEDSTSSDEAERIQELVAQRQGEYESLDASRPQPPAFRASPEVDDQVETRRLAEKSLQAEVTRAEVERAVLKKRRTGIENALKELATEERRVRKSLAKIQQTLSQAGVPIDPADCLSVALNAEPLVSALTRTEEEIEAINAQLDDTLDPGLPHAIASRLELATAEREETERHLEAAEREFAEFRTRFEEWESGLRTLQGDEAMPSPESIRGLRAQLTEVRTTMPARLREREEERRRICRTIHEVLAQLASVYQQVAEPVQKHVAENPFTRDRYRLTIDVVMREAGLADRLFSHVGQSSGTFARKDVGRDKLQQLVRDADLGTPAGATLFAEELLDRLRRNHNADPPVPFDLKTGLKQGSTLLQISNLIFGLEYLQPAFDLALDRQPLRQLSPGQRGILLLVFYLIVDQGDEPLIIDQPEGNLNNQSIVDHLVPVFIAAKDRRQVIIVTHNPNLAVVCDAEQIIHCSRDIAAGNRLNYESGAIENPKFAQLSLDLLDGTNPAFRARRDTYEDGVQ